MDYYDSLSECKLQLYNRRQTNPRYKNFTQTHYTIGDVQQFIDVLSDANRYTVSKDDQLIKIRELEENKIMVSAMFIIGFPTDTTETINSTIDYAKYLNTSYAQFSVWTPYPGTPIYKKYEVNRVE